MIKRIFPNIEPKIVRILLRKRWWRKLFNYILVELQMGLKTSHVLGKPYWLTLDPTSFCQLKCPFCPTGAGRNVRPKASMKMEDFKRMIDSLGPTLLHIDFMNWGEPLLHPEIYDMIAYAKRFHIDTHLSTNLNKFSKVDAEKMVLSGLDLVVLSIDGVTQETYGKYRIGGDYNRVIKNLKCLVRRRSALGRKNPRIHWQFLVFKHNEHEIETVKRLGRELGAEHVGITAAYMPFKPGIRENWLPTQREYSLYDPESFPDSPPWEWENSKPKPNTNRGGGCPDPAPRQACLDLPMVDVKVYTDNKKRRLCAWPWAGITVNPDGSVSPCCSVEETEYDFGNCFREPLKNLWNNHLYRRARRHIRQYVQGKRDSIPNSTHACERCFSIGKSGFRFPHWWFSRHEKKHWDNQ